MATQTIERSVQRPAGGLGGALPRPVSQRDELQAGRHRRRDAGVVRVRRQRLFALTDLHSAKVRRIRRNPRVLVASCRANGKLRGEPVPARVEVLTATPELEHVQKLLMRALQAVIPRS